MISESVEARMSEARAARNRQDKEHPMLINIKDFRLMPNVPALRTHRNYRPFAGDPRATYDERKRIVETGQLMGRPVIVDSQLAKFRGGATATVDAPEADEPPFDVGKASREELQVFALRYYGVEIDPDGKTHLMTLRAKLRALAAAAGDMPASEDGAPPASESLA